MFMLDTDICIYLINERDAALRGKFESNANAICISAITYAELCFGAAHSARVEENARELAAFCLDLEVLPFDAAAGEHYGEIRQALMQRGRPIGANDLLIAAHARSAGATLVTNNERVFARVPELRTENWMEGSARQSSPPPEHGPNRFTHTPGAAGARDERAVDRRGDDGR